MAAGVACLGAAAEAAGQAQQYGEHREESSDELPTFRFAMEQNKGHVTDGGSARPGLHRIQGRTRRVTLAEKAWSELRSLPQSRGRATGGFPIGHAPDTLAIEE